MPSPSLVEWIALWPWAEMAMIVFGFAWGAMLGSFINVVVHRIPIGVSIVTTPSRCPTCGTAIRPYDNVPVLGWLWLRGRCRTCREPIAVTYPLVEAGCGGIVMVLAASELVSGGRWLPAYEGELSIGIDRLLRGDWWLLAVCVLHAAVALTVVTWSLLDGVGWRICPTHGLIAILLAMTAVALIPQASPPAIHAGAAWPALVSSLVGAATGAILGLAGRGQGMRWGMPLLGSVLGWQVVTLVAVMTTVSVLAARVAFGRGAASRSGLVLAVVGTLGLAFSDLMRRFVGWVTVHGSGSGPFFG